MATFDVSQARHKRPVVPIWFPVEEPMEDHLGQSKRHHRMVMTLFRLLESVVGARGAVGADQFVYWNGKSPSAVLAPDGFVKLGGPSWDFRSWKTWELGTPEVAFEILSLSDTREHWTLEEKIDRYQQLGVRELFVFDADAEVGERLRVWDRIEDDFVERVVENERALSAVIEVCVLVAPAPVLPVTLRLARDPEGTDLVLLAEEENEAAQKKLAGAEKKLAGAEKKLAGAEQKLAGAEQRIAELEAALAKR